MSDLVQLLRAGARDLKDPYGDTMTMAANRIDGLEMALGDAIALIRTRDEHIAAIEAWNRQLAAHIVKLACQYADLEQALALLEGNQSTKQ